MLLLCAQLLEGSCANILTGIVESIAEEEIDGTSAQITVRTDAGKVKVSMDTAATSDRGFFPQKGEKVTIAVRSENIRISKISKMKRSIGRYSFFSQEGFLFRKEKADGFTCCNIEKGRRAYA